MQLLSKTENTHKKTRNSTNLATNSNNFGALFLNEKHFTFKHGSFFALMEIKSVFPTLVVHNVNMRIEHFDAENSANQFTKTRSNRTINTKIFTVQII